MSEKEKPTIAELEALLNEPNKKINIMPDGSIVAVGGDENAYDAYIKQQDATIADLQDENERLRELENKMGSGWALVEAEALMNANKNQERLIDDYREALNRRNVENNTLMSQIDGLILHGKNMGDEILLLREKNDKLKADRDIDSGTIMKQNGEIQDLRSRLAACENERDELRKVVWWLECGCYPDTWTLSDKVARANNLDIAKLQKGMGK